ncbi:uncharacterized protein LOC135932680 [Pelmatolapia mariae]|uniref:uncharacterized protein LOC135932680 n=1 Tax=Pelmatolapia mariae TaxID=158779 RepID=UPI003211E811
MRNFDSLTVLLVCSLSRIPVSQPLEVQSGQEVTLLCSNFSSSPTNIFWYRMTNRAKLTCIAAMFEPHEPASFCNGFQNGKIEMSTNISTVFLKIKQVDLLDSGLYFCGYKMQKSTVIVEATDLVVQDTFIGLPNVMSVILGVLTVFLITVIVCLAVKIKKLQKGSSPHLNWLQQMALPIGGFFLLKGSLLILSLLGFFSHQNRIFHSAAVSCMGWEMLSNGDDSLATIILSLITSTGSRGLLELALRISLFSLFLSPAEMLPPQQTTP